MYIRLGKLGVWIFTICMLGMSNAEAGVRVGAHYEYGFSFEESLEQAGSGVGFEVGYGVDVLIVKITPELGFTYYIDSQMSVPKLGARITFGKIVAPGVYGHAVLPIGEGLGLDSIGFDAGLILDLAIIPKVDLGLHGGVMFAGQDVSARRIATVGIHGGFTF